MRVISQEIAGGWFEVLSPGEVISWRGDRAERPGLRQVPFQTC